MTNGVFDTRKEQIEKVFLPRLMRLLKQEGWAITGRGRRLIKEALKAAAMVGACAERERTLALPQLSQEARAEISKQGVLQVCGYGKEEE